MNTIVVRWIKTTSKEDIYKRVMWIIASDHPRFIEGSRFDYEFFNIATADGYTIVSLPDKE